MDLADFNVWLNSAAVGDVVIYFNGSLAREREPQDQANKVPLNALADAAWLAERSGIVCLTQRRVDVGKWEYLAVKRKAAVSDKVRKAA